MPEQWDLREQADGTTVLVAKAHPQDRWHDVATFHRDSSNLGELVKGVLNARP